MVPSLRSTRSMAYLRRCSRRQIRSHRNCHFTRHYRHTPRMSTLCKRPLLVVVSMVLAGNQPTTNHRGKSCHNPTLNAPTRAKNLKARAAGRSNMSSCSILYLSCRVHKEACRGASLPSPGNPVEHSGCNGFDQCSAPSGLKTFGKTTFHLWT